MGSVSPLATEMLTCCTALTMPRRGGNSTVRSWTSSRGWAVMNNSGPPRRYLVNAKTTPCTVERTWIHWTISAPKQPSRPPLRVDDVAQAVAEEVEAEHGDHQRQAGKKRDPPFA